MNDFIAIDFETANPQRVSACAIGYAKISDFEIIESSGYLIKPVGGHAPFQSKIHGIKEEHTYDKQDFGGLFPKIKNLFKYPLVAHSLFDKQVLDALSDYFSLGLNYTYIDSSSIAKERLPNIKNCKLKTLVRYFDLPKFKHHDAKEDAISCARVFLSLQGLDTEKLKSYPCDDLSEFMGLLMEILADDYVNYKEAFELLYWLEDHPETSNRYCKLYQQLIDVLSDDDLDDIESSELKVSLKQIMEELK